jgi:thiol:disulfide interchange protein DsbG
VSRLTLEVSIRPWIVLAALAAWPALADSPPLCIIPAPVAVASADQPPQVAPPEPVTAPPPLQAPAMTAVSGDLAMVPFVQHVISAGAAVTELGASHGVRSIAARSGDHFMIFQVAPDGHAAVSGAMTDLTAAQLSAIAGGNTIDLGV